MTFENLNLNQSLLEGLSAIGFLNPTPIQAQAIPIILENKDLIACAQTGTGKTGAFLLPLIHKIMEKGSAEHKVNTLVVVPTRELAIQIDQMLQGLAYFTPISSIAMYGGSGGSSFIQEKIALEQGADIVIATPGKLISHLNLKYAQLDELEHLVLDEADKMLDMGFYDDIKKIISYLPEKRQTLMFSATMPPKIRKLAKDIQNEPEQISIAIAKPSEGISQIAFWVYEGQKIGLINHILKVHQELKTVIVFSNKKENVKNLERAIKHLDIPVRAIHSDLEQIERENIIREFKNRQFRVLIGTDIIARGLDVENVDLVINYEVPPTTDDYVHRVGRTARAESQGFAFTFVSDRDQRDFLRLEKTLDISVTRFDIPPFLGDPPAEVSLSDIKKPFNKNRNNRGTRGKTKPGTKRRK